LRDLTCRHPLGAALQRDDEVDGAERAHVVPERRVEYPPAPVLARALVAPPPAADLQLSIRAASG
jgi:hypothetical protein